MKTIILFTCPVCKNEVKSPIEKFLETRLLYHSVLCNCPLCKARVSVRVSILDFLLN